MSSPHNVSWPGERQPSRWDVHNANEYPGKTFMERFKAALFQMDEATTYLSQTSSSTATDLGLVETVRLVPSSFDESKAL